MVAAAASRRGLLAGITIAALLAAAGAPSAAARNLTCGHKTRPKAWHDAKQADLDLFNARLANAAGNSMLDGARFAQDSVVVAPVTTVPVVFHVLRASTSVYGGNVPAAWVHAQIAVLNKYYEQAKYKFVLNKLSYTTNKDWYHMMPGTYTELEAKHALKVGGLKTLNVYTGQPSDPDLGGWSYLPDELSEVPSCVDGSVVAWYSLPGANKSGYGDYNTGKTLVHEVGHWLGLLHTFNPAYDAAGDDLGGCVGSGDYVSDTPAEKTANFGDCPSTHARNTCPAPGNDPVHNFMDYSIDVCRTGFTAGQRSRMHSKYKLYRASGKGYGGQSSNSAGGYLSGGSSTAGTSGSRSAGPVAKSGGGSSTNTTDAPPGGIPTGCSSCVCYPSDGYCICSCSTPEGVSSAEVYPHGSAPQ